MDDRDSFALPRLPGTARPLLGLTVLLVEDSLVSCEALRLMCQRSGARLRRADCLRSARRHLSVYRPSAVIVDMGLPDGSGAELIDEMSRARPRVGIILAISADPALRSTATAAGADGFLEKPLTSLATFQDAILSRLPADRQPVGPRLVRDEEIRPDQLAYHDDIAQAVEALAEEGDGLALQYALQFLTAAAVSAGDKAMVEAGQALAQEAANGLPLRTGIARIAGMVQDRLEHRAAI